MNRRIILIFLLFLSGVYIQSKPGEKYDAERNGLVEKSLSDWKEVLSDSCSIPISALNIALNAYYDFKHKNTLPVDTLLTIIDFSKNSIDKRLFILDLKNYKIIKNTWVAHGKNTGLEGAMHFSNTKNSNKSSLGVFLTKETYMGKHGYSLRIEGVNKGLNDNALQRGIVIHGANYVSEKYIEKYGRLGRSFGCPAIPVNESGEIIDLIKGGSLLFIYHPSIVPISQIALEILP